MKEIKKYFKEFSSGTKTMFKEFFNKKTNKKQRANMWTFLRLVSPFIALLLSIIGVLSANPIMFLSISGIVTGLGAATDFFDGRSARKYNSVSEYGKKLDQATDKIFSILTAINLLFFNLNYLFIIAGEVLISSVNLHYKKTNPELSFESSKLGKIKQWPLFTALGIGFFTPAFQSAVLISNILISLTALMEVLTSINYVKINEEEIKKNNLKNTTENIIIENDDENNNKENLNSISLSNNKSKLDTYKDLKMVLEEVINSKNNNVEDHINLKK